MAFIDFGNSELNRKALASGKSLADVYAIRGTEISDTSKTQYQIDQSSKPDQGHYKSKLNTPVLADLKFVGIKNYIDEQGNTYNFDDVVLQAVLVTINQSVYNGDDGPAKTEDTGPAKTGIVGPLSICNYKD